MPAAMRALPFLAAILPIVPIVAALGCGGRTGSDDDFSTEGFVDSSIDGSFDGTIDGTSDGRADVIGVDARDASSDVIAVDSRPDGIGVDVIGVDSGPDVIRIDSGSDVIGVDTAPDVIGVDVIGFDTSPDVIEIDSGVDTGPPTDGGIHCGPTGVDCDPSTEECCAMFGGAFSCVTKGTCGGFPISCSSAASCPPGDVCCLELGGPGGGGSASCTPGFCPGIQLCETTAECPPGTRCRRLFGGYRSCR